MKKKPKQIVLKKRRNEMRSQVYGISALEQFWREVHRLMEETGQKRSEVIVEACVSAWKKPELASKPVGRPRVRKG